MKRSLSVFLAVYLLWGSLIPGNSFFELSSLPSLVRHYQYHRSVESRISFIAFLKLHYTNDNHGKSDPKNHTNLPLQHLGNLVPIDEIVNAFTQDIAAGHFYSSGFFSYPPNSFFPDKQFSSAVFHPPSV